MATQKWANGMGGSAVSVVINLGKRCTMIAGVLPTGTLTIDLSTSKRGAKANTELIGFLSSLFCLSPEQVQIVAGEDSQEKLVSLVGIDPHDVEKIVRQALSTK